jgi:hypothetical protein
MLWGETIDNVSRYAYLDGDLVLVFAFWRPTHPRPAGSEQGLRRQDPPGSAGDHSRARGDRASTRRGAAGTGRSRSLSARGRRPVQHVRCYATVSRLRRPSRPRTIVPGRRPKDTEGAARQTRTRRRAADPDRNEPGLFILTPKRTYPLGPPSGGLTSGATCCSAYSSGRAAPRRLSLAGPASK